VWRVIVARLPALFRFAGFPAFWLSLSLGGLASSIAQIALSWTTLELTGSPLGVALTLAVRVVPWLLFGIPLGALSDRVDRRRMIRWTNLIAAGVGLAAALLVLGGALAVPAILVLSFVFGTIDSARIVATQAYAYDLVGAENATGGLALSNLGTALFGSVGALLGGVLIAWGGLGSGFGVAALAWLGAALLLGRWSAPVIQPGLPDGPVERPVERPVDRPVDRPEPSPRRALTLLARNRDLRWILALVVVAEVFGFSSMALTPTFARDVLQVGAVGLGVLVAGRSLGAVVGLAGLVRIGAMTRTGAALLVGGVAFGTALVVFGLSALPPLSLVVMFVIGAAAAGVDTLAQTLLQHATEDAERGAAMGVWLFGVGIGPIGVIGLGAAATVFGAPAAQVAFGVMLIGLSVVLASVGPVRRLR
jgi:MFS family permease